MSGKINLDAGIKTFAVRSLKVYEEYKKILTRNGIKIADKMDEDMRLYIKQHGKGNAQFQITQFVDENMRACPAFWSSHDTWLDYMKKIDDKEFESLSKQLNTMLNVNSAAYQSRYKMDVQAF